MISKAQAMTESRSFREFFGTNRETDLKLELLAQGEYHANFLFYIRDQPLVLRINTGSQLHLEKQVSYEYRALTEIHPSGRTPKPIYLDDSSQVIEEGVLVMEYLPGRPLDYRKDLGEAARVLSDIHALKVEETQLMEVDAPLDGIFQECLVMAEKYLSWQKAPLESARLLERMIEATARLPLKEQTGERHYINTELNSGNFLISSHSHLVDWEKPIISEISQDLGHFLAPTTTYWKSDVILSPEEMRQFITRYRGAADERFDTYSIQERLPLFIKATCLRGISWSAMALREYDAPRALVNADTHQKVREYLSVDFLEMIYKHYMVRP